MDLECATTILPHTELCMNNKWEEAQMDTEMSVVLAVGTPIEPMGFWNINIGLFNKQEAYMYVQYFLIAIVLENIKHSKPTRTHQY